jgi:hypothetical protein
MLPLESFQISLFGIGNAHYVRDMGKTLFLSFIAHLNSFISLGRLRCERQSSLTYLLDLLENSFSFEGIIY